MKPGRNDPCACGSGKKYKHCCLAAVNQRAEEPANLAWRRLRRSLEGFPERMANFVADAYGPGAWDEAWVAFSLWDDTEFDPYSPHIPVFMPWMYHRWSPDPEETGVADDALHGVPPTRAFLQRKGRKLEPVLRDYLEACLGAPFSFFEIEHCEPRRGFRTVDLFSGDRHEVLEGSASQTMQVGDLLYGQLVSSSGVTLLEACPMHAMPPIRKIDVLDLRKHISSSGDLFPGGFLDEDGQEEVRELYLDIMEDIIDPQPPALRNTDGEDVVMQKLVFDIDSPEAAFDALRHLDFQSTAEHLLKDAEYDAQGALLRVNLDWKKPGNRANANWTNTVLGSIQIDGRRLCASVNSNERAQAFREIVERSLGGGARYRMAEVQSADKLMSGVAEANDDDIVRGPAELTESPELQAEVARYLAEHYEAWPELALPALGGRTLLAAAQYAEGREQVEALVRQIERDSRRMQPAVDATVFQRLRRRLGLDEQTAS